MPFSQRYDHFDHLLDEIEHAQRVHPDNQSYVARHEHHGEQDERVTRDAAIAKTWLLRSERIIRAARMLVDRRTLVIEELHGHGTRPDQKVLPAELREELAQLEMTPLLGELQDVAGRQAIGRW